MIVLECYADDVELEMPQRCATSIAEFVRKVKTWDTPSGRALCEWALGSDDYVVIHENDPKVTRRYGITTGSIRMTYFKTQEARWSC